MTDFKMTDQVIRKMTNHTLKMTHLLIKLNLSFSIQKDLKSMQSNHCEHSKPELWDLSKRTTLFRSNLRFSNKWSVIFKVLVSHLQSTSVILQSMWSII